MGKLKLSTKMFFLGIAGLICVVAIMLWSYSRIEKLVYSEKQIMLKRVVETAFSLLAEHQDMVKAGDVDLAQAQKLAASRIKNLRYNENEYFWINDLSPRMIMHPYKPELDGKPLEGFADPAGKHLFVEFVKTCKENGSGYVDYQWPKPGATKPVPKISYVKVFEPWGWIIGSGVYIDDIASEMAGIRNLFLAVGTFILVFGFVVCRRIITSSTRPISLAVHGLTAVAETISSASERLSSTSLQLAGGASQQAAAIQETGSSLEEISSMTRRNAESAHDANLLMGQTKEIVVRANDTMSELTSSMQEISKASEETRKIIKTIDEIAFQTNLLALNAAVEAARAGEAGAGFAVVADEVRNLAMRAAEAARNTADLIDGTVKKIQNGSTLVKKNNDEFSGVADMVTKTSGLIGEIAASSREQAQGLEHLSRAVQEMDKVVQQNAESADENASVARDVSEKADPMKHMISELESLVNGRGTESGEEKTLSASTRPTPEQIRLRSRKQSRAEATVPSAARVRPEAVIPFNEGGMDNF